MARSSILILLGILVLLTPYLGLPYAWLMVLLPILGLCVLLIGITLRGKRRAPVIAPESYETHSSV
ncbi:MAG TPA: hypothetical protein PK109_02325 [Candidatus Paceibacterota bacterium]|nr:hypothetical protein [Candidatus Paceibacterota bacterium]